jgi:hypothetical protein
MHGVGAGGIGGRVEVHHEHAGGGHVVDVQEFAHRRTAAPDHHFRGVGAPGFVEAP